MTEQAAKSTEVAVSTNEPVSSQEVLAKVKGMADNQLSLYSTIIADDLDGKKKVLNAITNSVPVSDHLRKKIMLKDFVIQAASMIDDETAEERDVLRTILIAADGVAYHAISDGLFKALQTYTGLLGHPSEWPEEGIAVTVEEVKSRRGFKFFTIKLA